jgi:hypothetical protein
MQTFGISTAQRPAYRANTMSALLEPATLQKGTRPDYTPTPDRRYYVVRGRLWRLSNPFLDEETHRRLVADLMAAKRTVSEGEDALQRIAARLKADALKRALGERGDMWWTDGAPDYHRCLAVNTPYAEWYRYEPSGIATN